MADYETASEGSHCVRRDVFGHCIYTHNNFAKGNSRLNGMPVKENKNFAPGSGDPLLPVGKVEEDPPDDFRFEGQIKEVVNHRLTDFELEAQHIMAATGLNQEQGDTPEGRARGRRVAQDFLDRKVPGKYRVHEDSDANFLLLEHVRPEVPANPLDGNAVAPTARAAPPADRTPAPSPTDRAPRSGTQSAADLGIDTSNYPETNPLFPSYGRRVEEESKEPVAERESKLPETFRRGGSRRGGSSTSQGYGLRRRVMFDATAERNARIAEDMVPANRVGGDDDSNEPRLDTLNRNALQQAREAGAQLRLEARGWETLTAQQAGRRAARMAARRTATAEARQDANARGRAIQRQRQQRRRAPTDNELLQQYDANMQRPQPAPAPEAAPAPEPAPAAQPDIAPVDPAAQPQHRPENTAGDPEPAPAVPVGPEVQEVPAVEPRTMYTVGLPGSRVNASKGSLFDWLGNLAGLAGDVLKTTPIGRKLFSRGQQINDDAVAHVVNKIRDLQERGIITPEQYHSMVGNSRAGSLMHFIARDLGTDFQGMYKAFNAPPLAGMDEAGAEAVANGASFENLRGIGDIASSLRATFAHYLTGGLLGKPVSLQGINTRTFQQSGNVFQRHMTGGPTTKLLSALLLNGAQLQQMEAIHDHRRANEDADFEGDEGVRSEYLSAEQRESMRGGPAEREAAIERQRNLVADSDRAITDVRNRIHEYNETPLGKFTNAVNDRNINIPAGIGGAAVGFGVGLGLSDLEKGLGIGKNSYYAVPAANAVAVDALLRGAGSRLSGGGWGAAISAPGALSAASGAVIGSLFMKLVEPKDGFQSKGGEFGAYLGSGAVGGVGGYGVLAGATKVGQIGKAWYAGGAGGTAAAEGGGGGAAAGVAGGTGIEMGPMGAAAAGGTAGEGTGAAAALGADAAGGIGAGGAATGTAAAEGGGLAGGVAAGGAAGEDAAGLAAAVEAGGTAGGEVGSAFGPLGALGAAGIGTFFAGIAYLMGKSQIGKDVAANVKRHTDIVKNKALEKANAAKRALTGKEFGNLSGSDIQNFSQSAINAISGGTFDPAAFLG